LTYFDTSALIKRFVVEKGSPEVRRLVDYEKTVATATVAYAEAYAGLTRRYRERGLSRRQYASACEQFETEWGAYVRVELHAEVLSAARSLIQRHGLRGVDGVHLASAVVLQRGLGEAVTFVAADDRLLRAAAAERMPVIDVESD
jgi:uncharacterized protein